MLMAAKADGSTDALESTNNRLLQKLRPHKTKFPSQLCLRQTHFLPDDRPFFTEDISTCHRREAQMQTTTFFYENTCECCF